MANNTNYVNKENSEKVNIAKSKNIDRHHSRLNPRIERQNSTRKTRRIIFGSTKHTKDISSKNEGFGLITHRNRFEALLEKHEECN